MKIKREKFVSYCRNHNWESMPRDTSSEAQLDLDGHIGWFPNESHSESGVRMENEIVTFKVSVTNEDENNISITLCTSEELIIPKKLLNRFEKLGTTQNEEKTHEMFLISIDNSTIEGQLITDLATIINKNHLVDKENLKNTHTIQVTGYACSVSHAYYNTDFNVTNCALQSAEGCSVLEVIKTGQKQIRIRHTGINGTPCGNNYTGKVYVDIW